MLLRDLPGFNAIKVGTLYWRPREFEDLLSRCCRMVLREHTDRSLPLWRAGSATLLRFGRRKLVALTRHQLELRNGEPPSTEVLETIRISTGFGILRNIPLRTCIHELSHPEEEYHDVLLFDVADKWDHDGVDAPHFFPIEPFAHEERLISYIIGYPSLPGVIDAYHENFQPELPNAINIKRAIMDCVLDTNYASKASYFRRYRYTRSDRVMDGYSGGAIFSVVGEPGDLRAVFDGMVIRAGGGFIYLVDADYFVTVMTNRPDD